MVSPVDKNGGDVETLEGSPVSGITGEGNTEYFRARLNQAAPDGEGISYSASRPFAGAVSSPWTSQYVAKRNSDDGWITESLNPPLSNYPLNLQASQEIQFKAISEDLCSAWVVGDTDRLLVEGAPPGVPNLYRRDNCGSSGFELLTTSPPPGFGKETDHQESGYFPQIQGLLSNGCSVFRANAKLTADATESGVFQVYEHCPGKPLRLISVLPNGVPGEGHSSLGTSTYKLVDFRNDSVRGAAAAEGQRLFFTVASPSGPGEGFQPGELFMRANPMAVQSNSGECNEKNKACTVPIGGPNAAFVAAASDGSVAIFQIGDELFEAQIQQVGATITSTPALIAEGVVGVVGTSDDAKRVYFVSEDVLATGASLGEPNLYFYEQGVAPDLVATLSPRDSNRLDLEMSIDNFRSGFRTSRVTPDGLHIAFMSQASLTGFDNLAAASEEPAFEVFRYDAAADGGDGEVTCISCNVTGVRPEAQRISFDGPIEIWAAAKLPRWESQQQPSRALSDDGSRIFFESYDALVLSDTNGARDVYEWEQATGISECDQLGAGVYSAGAGGCLSLISSGQSSEDSEFIDASSDGRDVFFTTISSLVAEDTDSIDLYDARAGGGIPPRVPATDCEGENCQPVTQQPVDPGPASAVPGAGNPPKPKPKPKKCSKGKHKVKRGGKVKCVTNKKKAKGSGHGKTSKGAKR